MGANLELLATGSVTSAPSAPLTVTITSSDSSKLLLSPSSTDPTGTNQGVGSFTATLPAGKGVNSGFPGFYLQSLVSSGSAQVTLSADGYVPATATINFTPSGFVVAGPNNVGNNFTVQLGAPDTNLTISPAQLDAGGNVLQPDQQLRGGLNLSVALNNSTPATATISGSPISLLGGSRSNVAGSLTLHTVAAGSTLLSVVQPSGFMTPVAGAQLTATVNSPTITLAPNVVGYHLQVLGNGGLNTPAPAGGLAVTITSSDASKALLSTNPAVAGSSSILVTVPASGNTLPPFYIQGLVSSGSATLSASGSGYVSATANVLLAPSGFVINSQVGTNDFSGTDFTTTTLANPTSLQLSVWQLNSSLAPVTEGDIAGGVSASVGVVSGTPGSGTIAGSPVTIQPGDPPNRGTSFQPNPNCATPCTSVLTVTQPAGFSVPNPGGHITATVAQSAVTLRMTQSVIGNNLQVLAGGALDVPAPSDMQITITSSNPSKILLSSSPTGAGSASIVVTVPAGNGVDSLGFPNYYVQSLSSDSSVPVTLTATPPAGSGFASSTFNVTPAPSGFVLEGPNGVGADFGAVRSNGNVSLTVRAAVLDPNTGNPTLLYEAVRGGFSASVTVSSDNTAVATIGGSPLAVTSGNAGGTITLQPHAAGSANITLSTPTGYAKPATGDHLMVTFN